MKEEKIFSFKAEVNPYLVRAYRTYGGLIEVEHWRLVKSWARSWGLLPQKYEKQTLLLSDTDALNLINALNGLNQNQGTP